MIIIQQQDVFINILMNLICHKKNKIATRVYKLKAELVCMSVQTLVKVAVMASLAKIQHLTGIYT